MDQTTGTALAVRPPLVPQPHGGRIHAGGVPGHDGGGTGRPSKALGIRRKSAVEKALNEAHRILEHSRQSPVPLLNLNDLVNLCAKFDEELRVKQTEISFRDPLTVRVVSAE